MKMLSRRCKVALGVLAGLCLRTSTISAATISYYQFQDGAAGTTASSVATQVNGPALNGTAQFTSGGAAPTFDSATPGTSTTDGVGGPTVNASNSSSLLFVNAGAPASTTSNSGGQVSVPDASSALDLRNFTIEAFVKVNRDVDFPDIVNKSRADAGGSSWMMDVNSNGTLRLRVDSQPIGSGTGSSGFNQSFATSTSLQDGKWHHVAATYNDSTKGIALYVDYTQVATGTTINNIVYDSNPMLIGAGGGGRAFDGWIDDVRYSSTVLAPAQFLQAVPEPGSLALCGFLSLALLRRRRRCFADVSDHSEND